MSRVTVPYDLVSDTCQELVTLAGCLEKAATDSIARNEASHEMVLIRLAAARIGCLADNLLGGEMAGGADYWFQLPGSEVNRG